MAAPTFLAATQSGSTDTQTSTKTCPIPAGTSANTVIVLVVEMSNAGSSTRTITWPAGFTEVTGSPFVVVAPANQYYRVAWKRSTAGEGSGNYSLTFSSSVWNIVMAAAIDGCRTTGDPFEAVQVGVNSGTAVNSLAVTTTDTDLLLFVGIGDSNNGPMDWVPPTAPGSFTEVIDNDYDHISWYRDTASGSRTVSGATMSTSEAHGQMVMAFVPSASGGTSGTLTASAGDAPAAGGTATFAGGTFSTIAGDAPAAGGSARFTGDPLAPFVVAASADGHYLIDADGNGIMPQFDTIWPMIQQAGNTARNGGSATWQQDIDHWVSNRSSQGYNGLKFSLFGQVINGAPNGDSRTWDSKWPFGSTATGTAYANPSTGLAADYWERVDYLIDAAATAGMTCFIHIIYPDDVSPSLNGVMCAGGGGAVKPLSEFQALGTALGNRYKNRPNIVWVIGGDYFDLEVTKIEGTWTSLRATGDAHLWTVQNMADLASHLWSTSRKDDSGSTMQLGTDIADINACYIYDPSYLAFAAAWAETPALPVIWYDGYYEQSGDALTMRRFAGWALTYAHGVQYGNENTWAQPSGWRSTVSSPSSTVGQVLGMRASVANYGRWTDLVPDLSSTFITAGRGSGNTFVTGGKTPDGALAVIYIPNASTAITVDTAQMAAGYTVTWVDPTNGATSAGTPGTSFSKGNNAAGSTDWLLVLAAPTGTPGTLTATAGDGPAAGGSVSLTAGGTVATVAGDSPAAGGAVAFTSSAVFATVAGDAPTDGGSASFNGAATFSTVLGDATADGAAAAFTAAATFATVLADVPADGGPVALLGGATLDVLEGDAPADGGSVAFTAAAAFTIVAGDAPADGGVAAIVGGAASTLTALTGDAPAAGGDATVSAGAVFSTAAGDAAADGDVAALLAGAVGALTALTGDATADGGTATLTGSAGFVALTGDVVSDGGVVTFTGSAVVVTVAGDAAARGGLATFQSVVVNPLRNITLRVIAEHDRTVTVVAHERDITAAEHAHTFMAVDHS